MNEDQCELFELRFVNKKDDTVFRVKQYGKSEKELADYWNSYFGHNDDKYMFVDVIGKVKKTCMM